MTKDSDVTASGDAPSLAGCAETPASDYVRKFIEHLRDPEMGLTTEKQFHSSHWGDKGKAAILAALVEPSLAARDEGSGLTPSEHGSSAALRAQGKWEVRVTYSFGNYPAMDKVAHAAAGSQSDFSGVAVDIGDRDIGWVLATELEASRMRRRLKAAGFRATLRFVPDEPRGLSAAETPGFEGVKPNKEN